MTIIIKPSIPVWQTAPTDVLDECQECRPARAVESNASDFGESEYFQALYLRILASLHEP